MFLNSLGRECLRLLAKGHARKTTGLQPSFLNHQLWLHMGSGLWLLLVRTIHYQHKVSELAGTKSNPRSQACVHQVTSLQLCFWKHCTHILHGTCCHEMPATLLETPGLSFETTVGYALWVSLQFFLWLWLNYRDKAASEKSGSFGLPVEGHSPS